jgi:hypothetical protein
MWSAPRGAGQVYDLHQHVYALRTKLDKEYSPLPRCERMRARACMHAQPQRRRHTHMHAQARNRRHARIYAHPHEMHTRHTHCACMRACGLARPRTRRYAAHELCRAELQKLRVLTGAGMDA